MFDFGYHKDQIVRHDEICKAAHCGCMGGIRYSKEKNAVILFIKNSSNYRNNWKNNILFFMGSGSGNQTLGRSNGNLYNAEKNGSSIHLFEWVDTINCKYKGQLALAGEPKFVTEKNKYGDTEKKVVFPLQLKKE